MNISRNKKIVVVTLTCLLGSSSMPVMATGANPLAIIIGAIVGVPSAAGLAKWFYNGTKNEPLEDIRRRQEDIITEETQAQTHDSSAAMESQLAAMDSNLSPNEQQKRARQRRQLRTKIERERNARIAKATHIKNLDEFGLKNHRDTQAIMAGIGGVVAGAALGMVAGGIAHIAST